MRIISGSLKGRNLLVSKNFKGRPTTDFAREGLFNVLGNLIDLEKAAVLDLFAGTGAFGIECMSRGATALVAVDIQSLHLKFIRDNFLQFSIRNAETVKQDVFRFLEQSQRSFDLVFADPPYDMREFETLPDAIFTSSSVAMGGLVIIEHGKRTSFENHRYYLQTRTYSNVSFSFFRRND